MVQPDASDGGKDAGKRDELRRRNAADFPCIWPQHFDEDTAKWVVDEVGEEHITVPELGRPSACEDHEQNEPNQAEQGTQWPSAQINIFNAYLVDYPPPEILFDPPDGIVVSNVWYSGATNTEIIHIGFNFEITTDAPIGYRDVTLIWEDRNKSVTGVDSFKVLPKTD